ncbi:hypothetical protein MGLY_16330 [Neomoorella glycerini]|uniref:Uncharacterized protein n=1 Tax=Neomoorella glycerini TaxID=55779 RepID=A0A6I5ZQL7_9FIRM|nr:hypothetical protein [Moorella glycerini]QGP92262.1 hypothetical protein MGLY_16330 [Moorella glycerini]
MNRAVFVDASAWIASVRVSQIMEEAGLKIFFDYQDKNWGVVDCISLATMRLLNCRRAFVFDGGFLEGIYLPGNHIGVVTETRKFTPLPDLSTQELDPGCRIFQEIVE